jgi:hypothetical protein
MPGRPKRAAAAAPAAAAAAPAAKRARGAAALAANAIPDITEAMVRPYSTPALLAWGRDYGAEFPAAIDGSNRAVLIRWLTETVGVHIPTPALLRSVWTACINREGLGDAYVELHVPKAKAKSRATAAQPVSDEEMVDDAESAADVEEVVHVKPNMATKSRAAQQKQPDPAWVSSGSCPHCTKVCSERLCSYCGMRADKEFTTPENENLRVLHRLHMTTGADSTSAGTSDKRAAAAGGSTDSRLDTEFNRRATEGGAYPAAEDASRITAERVFELTYEAYRGTAYRPPSKAEIALLQSGRFAELGFFVPTLLSDSTSKRARESAPMAILTANGIELPASIEAIRVDGLATFMAAMFSRVLPALINRPNATANWIALSCTILELNRSHGWTVASEYLHEHLASKVHKRQPIGAVEPLILQSVLGRAFASHGAGGSHAAATPHSASAATRPVGATANDLCWNWSHKECHFPDRCTHIHKCFYGTTGAKCLQDFVHKGKTCEKCPPHLREDKQSVKFVQNDRRGGAGGKPGAKGGRSGSSPQ